MKLEICAWILIKKLPTGYDRSAFVHEGIDIALFDTRKAAVAFASKFKVRGLKPKQVIVQVGEI